MILDNIKRIGPPSVADFQRDYVSRGRPCVIRGLFSDAPLARLDRQPKALRALGDLELEIQPNYITFLETGTRTPPRTLTLRAYLQEIEHNPRTRELCVEYDTPAGLEKLLPPPIYCQQPDANDVVSATFVANRGNFNHLHFDDDQRDVLLYQVFGRKRFIVIVPELGRSLDAYLVPDPETARALSRVPARDANGRVYLEQMSEQDKEAFCRYAGAVDCLLEPGETLFMPKLAWHYVEYLDTAMSVTYRLGRGPTNKRIAALMPYPDHIAQMVACRFRDEEAMAKRHPHVVQAIEAAYHLAASDHDAALTALRSTLDQAFDALYGQSAAGVRAMRELYHRTLYQES